MVYFIRFSLETATKNVLRKIKITFSCFNTSRLMSVAEAIRAFNTRLLKTVRFYFCPDEVGIFKRLRLEGHQF